MNQLRITIDPYSDTCSASLNGRPLSPYSELSNFIKMPFMKWITGFYEAADKDVNDNYNLTLLCGQLEAMMFEVLKANHSSCCNITKEPFALNSSPKERCNSLVELAKKHNVILDKEKFEIPVCSAFSISKNEFITMVNRQNDAFCIVVDSCYDITQAIDLDSIAIILQISDIEEISNIGNGKLLWKLPTNKIDEVLSAIAERFAEIPFVFDSVNVVNRRVRLSDEEKYSLLVLSSIEPIISVHRLENLKVGKTQEVLFDVFPRDIKAPMLRVHSSDTSVVSVNGAELKAISCGTALISIYKSDEIAPFFKTGIEVLSDNTIKKIVLNRSESVMGIGKMQKIGIETFPANANDADYIVWSVDNKAAASVDNNGVVKAKNAGRITVTASTMNVKESVTIDILPNITKLTLSVAEAKLYKGESLLIGVACDPSNCFDSTYVWTTNDKDVACAEIMPDGTTCIKTVSPGDCVLTCIATDGGCTASCKVTVVEHPSMKKTPSVAANGIQSSLQAHHGKVTNNSNLISTRQSKWQRIKPFMPLFVILTVILYIFLFIIYLAIGATLNAPEYGAIRPLFEAIKLLF